MFFSFFCDAYDGLVARATNSAPTAASSSTPGGPLRGPHHRARLPLVLPRRPVIAAIVALVLIGSSVMGYARAKGESVGIHPNVG